jgi:hypothetical protein
MKKAFVLLDETSRTGEKKRKWLRREFKAPVYTVTSTWRAAGKRDFQFDMMDVERHCSLHFNDPLILHGENMKRKTVSEWRDWGGVKIKSALMLFSSDVYNAQPKTCEAKVKPLLLVNRVNFFTAEKAD